MKNTIKIDLPKHGNTLYMIAYTSDGKVGIDYTSNMAELLELLIYHEKHSDDFQVYSIGGKDNE
jgi:hypothetical protein